MSEFIDALRLVDLHSRKAIIPKRLSVSVKEIAPDLVPFSTLSCYEANVVWRSRINGDPKDKERLLILLQDRLRWDLYKDFYELLMDLNEAVFCGDDEKILEAITAIKTEAGIK